MIESAPAHVRERRQLDRAALEQLPDFVESHQIVERVVHGTKIGIDFLRKVAGQESQPLPRFHRRAHEYDSLHLIALQRIHRAGDREIGLAGARRADCESEIVRLNLPDILVLARRPAVQSGALGEQHRRRFDFRALRTRDFDQAELQVFDAQASVRQAIEIFQRLGRELRLFRSTVHRENFAATGDCDVERGFNLFEICVERAAQIVEALVVDRCETKLD
jgi:hypothetical protein